MIYDIINSCRICKNNNLIDVIKLGEQAITSRFPINGDFSTSKTPLTLCLCRDCTLLQLRESTKPDELYEHQYGYRSGISNTMREHLKQYQEEILTYIHLQDGDIVLDIGSNDSTMLQYYLPKYKRIGIDPTGKQFQHYYGDVKLIPDYFTKEIFQSHYGNNEKCKIVSSISMFYDLPDPIKFAKDIYDILHDDGVWTCEQSYVFSMLKQNSFDTICHEHLEYYSIHAIKKIADTVGFNILDIHFNDCNGGSFRIYFGKNKINNNFFIDSYLQKEIDMGVYNPYTYKDFMINCDNEMNKLNHLIDTINNNEQQIWIYGASTKGNCLLQYANITDKQIKYAVERNPNKIGKMTVTGIEIISEEKMRENPPEYLLVLPWHFREEIIKREDDFLEKGGKLVFPLPHLEIYTKKEKILITGCDGFIGGYIKELWSQSNKYTLFGITQKIRYNEKDITKFMFDLQDYSLSEKIIDIIKPTTIVHLAGISSSIEAFYNPITAIMKNGIIVSQICEIIHKNKWKIKLFNASSSEIYKGHKEIIIDDMYNSNLNYKLHNHPYSIGKILGHSIVDFYRDTYNLPFSNGIIFTVESAKKGEQFLLNKIKKHITQWNKDKVPLSLGSLDSYRNIIHPYDVVNAIEMIIHQEKGDNYVISGDFNYKMKNIVMKMYELNNISLYIDKNIIYEKISKLPIIIMNDIVDNGLDKTIINIQGIPTKLKNLGWKITKNIDDILSEFSSF